MKLTMIPNHNRTLILESGMELNYIGNILHQVIKNDSNILSIGIYTPTGIDVYLPTMKTAAMASEGS